VRLSDVLSKLKWNGKLENCDIIILHRGAPGDRKEISGSNITEIKKSYIMFRNGGKETFIPLHRVMEITEGSRILWKKTGRKGDV